MRSDKGDLHIGPHTPRTSGVRAQVRRPPSVLVIGSSMVRHVAVRDGHSSCRTSACVNDFTSSALQLMDQNSSTASTVVIEAGVNNLKYAMSEISSKISPAH